MNQVIPDNDSKFLELIFREIRKISPNVLFDIQYFPTLVRVKIQISEETRGKIFNKLHHIHSIYNLTFRPTQFLKRDKSLISFDFLVTLCSNID